MKIVPIAAAIAVSISAAAAFANSSVDNHASVLSRTEATAAEVAMDPGRTASRSGLARDMAQSDDMTQRFLEYNKNNPLMGGG